MFLAKGVRNGWLVPTGWNQYRIPNEHSLQLLGRIANPLHRRLVSWAAILPDEMGRKICFASPRLWRDTDLSVDNLLPVIPLRPREEDIPGLAPQWGAFYQDLVDSPELWRLEAGSERLTEFLVPAAPDVGLLLVASLDPRWRGAYHQLPGTTSDQIRDRASRLGRPEQAPRGVQMARIGIGPPHRLRLLVPKWYLDNILQVTQESIFHQVLGGRQR